jgi:lipopolysaccharide export system protein LptC
MTSEPKLNFIRPRVTRRAAKARVGGVLVARLRIVLPLLGLLALIALIAWPFLNSHRIQSTVMKNIPDLAVENLLFSGQDSKNEPYTLKAARVTRPGGANNVYDLQMPEADIALQEGAWVAGKATTGRFDQDKKLLWLSGDVHIFHDNGSQFTTDEMHIDLNTNNAQGDKPILIQGGFGTIQGQAFRATDSGKAFIIKGPAKALLNLHAATPSDKPVAVKP